MPARTIFVKLTLPQSSLLGIIIYRKGAPIDYPNDLTPYIKLNSAGSISPCPAGGVYHIGKVGDTPTCTLSTVTPPHKLD